MLLTRLFFSDAVIYIWLARSIAEVSDPLAGVLILLSDLEEPGHGLALTNLFRFVLLIKLFCIVAAIDQGKLIEHDLESSCRVVALLELFNFAAIVFIHRAI